jgi:tripartite-type tricarboxylate transporter receptor subunit TctC
MAWQKYLPTVVSLLFCLIGPFSAQAQTDFPNKSVKIVVPFPPGGGADIIARMIGAKLSEKWKQPVIVDNRAGASGNIGAEFVSKQPPDGYTWLLTSAPFAIAPAVFNQLNFDPIKNFTPITQIATVPLIVVTRADSPLKNMEDLIALARKDGEKVTFGSFGNGSPAHLVGESMNQIAKLKMTHVPYKGTSAALPDVVSGQLTFAILDAISITPMIKSGQLRAIAIMGRQRSPALPDVPTLAQAGIPFETVGWHAVFAPAGMPKDLAERLNQEINAVIALPEIREKIIAGGSIPASPPWTVDGWSKQFSQDVKTWGDIARQSGAKND